MTQNIVLPTIARPTKDSMIVTWSKLLATDCGQAVDIAPYNDVTFECFGTTNGVTTTLYGTSDPAVLTDRAASTIFTSATANWKTLTDTLGNNIAGTALLKTVLEHTQYVVPVNSAGGGSTSITVILTCHRNKI